MHCAKIIRDNGRAVITGGLEKARSRENTFAVRAVVLPSNAQKLAVRVCSAFFRILAGKPVFSRLITAPSPWFRLLRFQSSLLEAFSPEGWSSSSCVPVRRSLDLRGGEDLLRGVHPVGRFLGAFVSLHALNGVSGRSDGGCGYASSRQPRRTCFLGVLRRSSAK